MLLSRKSSMYWQEYNRTLNSVKQMRKNKKNTRISVEEYVDPISNTLPGGRQSMSRNINNGNQSQQQITVNNESVKYKGPTRPQSAEVFRRHG